VGRRGEHWWNEDRTEWFLSFDSSLLIIESAMFTASEYALYAIRPEPTRDHHGTLQGTFQAIFNPPVTENPVRDSATYAIMVTLAGMSESLRCSPCLFQPYRSSLTPASSSSCFYHVFVFYVFYYPLSFPHDTLLEQLRTFATLSTQNLL